MPLWIVNAFVKFPKSFTLLTMDVVYSFVHYGEGNMLCIMGCNLCVFWSFGKHKFQAIACPGIVIKSLKVLHG